MAVSVTVLGAGPTGLAAALALRSRGFSVRVLERNDGTVTNSRAVAVNRQSLLHLQTVGATEHILARAEPARRVRFFSDGKPLATFQIPHPREGPPTIVALPQDVTEEILADRLRAAGVEVEWSTEAKSVDQSDGRAAVDADGPEGALRIESDFVLGAEGSHSVTRESLGLEFRGHRYEDEWTLFDAVVDWPWPGVQAAAFAHRSGRVLFMITLGDGRHRAMGTFEDLEARVRELMDVGEISWRNTFSLSERRVASFGRGRVWVAGDAAHIHSPVGGLGMNLGIDDAFDFAATVADGDWRGFERRRLAAARRVMRIADRGYRMVTSRNPAVRTLRDLGIRLVGSSAMVRRRLAAAVFGADAAADAR